MYAGSTFLPGARDLRAYVAQKSYSHGSLSVLDDVCCSLGLASKSAVMNRRDLFLKGARRDHCPLMFSLDWVGPAALAPLFSVSASGWQPDNEDAGRSFRQRTEDELVQEASLHAGGDKSLADTLSACGRILPSEAAEVAHTTKAIIKSTSYNNPQKVKQLESEAREATDRYAKKEVRSRLRRAQR